MSNMSASTPARICLFGEHQDYLGLDVIAAAISLRIRIELNSIVTSSTTNTFTIHHPDLHECEQISLEYPLVYSKDRDYYRSVLNILSRKGRVLTHALLTSISFALSFTNSLITKVLLSTRA